MLTQCTISSSKIAFLRQTRDLFDCGFKDNLVLTSKTIKGVNMTSTDANTLSNKKEIHWFIKTISLAISVI